MEFVHIKPVYNFLINNSSLSSASAEIIKQMDMEGKQKPSRVLNILG